ncbi:MAG: PfaD family polyunsaturated fatty acid/polyketide biosynthesis protein [Candidatus Riflebacteria bacterium]|nr:PfaD family polyunsaturated fatty acid/polyketide biosynthesis protein [Candidatus Riflebacteria bacterium]
MTNSAAFEISADEKRNFREALYNISRSFAIFEKKGKIVIREIGTLFSSYDFEGEDDSRLLAVCPAFSLKNLGDKGFCRDYGLKYPYIGGSMAHGISTPEISEALARGGMLGFVGAGGQSPSWVKDAIERLQKSIPDLPFGFNLIHSPNEPELEDILASMYINSGIKLIEASAFLSITLPLVRYRVHGIHRTEDGKISTPNRIIAKISRFEVAAKFYAPPPEKMLKELVNRREITVEQAELASKIPMAQDVTAEADSGGHTDNRPALCLFPTISAMKDRLSAQHNYSVPLRCGIAGGLSTPHSVAAAFSMGAAYIMTGSVNQACVESGTSQTVREMLTAVEQADVCMAPAGDMFEMGANVQVLKRGTMFPMRAQKLYDLYKRNDSLDAISESDRQNLEKSVFKTTLNEVWNNTRNFFLKRDPAQVERAERDPKHKMALVFRWYLGLSPKWAIEGNSERKIDYQIWCGPAMGAFNEWAKGSHFEKVVNRKVAEVALNLLFGGAVTLRSQALKYQGIEPANITMDYRPLMQQEIERYHR